MSIGLTFSGHRLLLAGVNKQIPYLDCIYRSRILISITSQDLRVRLRRWARFPPEYYIIMTQGVQQTKKLHQVNEWIARSNMNIGKIMAGEIETPFIVSAIIAFIEKYDQTPVLVGRTAWYGRRDFVRVHWESKAKWFVIAVATISENWSKNTLKFFSRIVQRSLTHSLNNAVKCSVINARLKYVEKQVLQM